MLPNIKSNKESLFEKVKEALISPTRAATENRRRNADISKTDNRFLDNSKLLSGEETHPES
jgi:hypothetical protein